MAKENNTVIQAFKYRLYPTRKQADVLQFTLDRNRDRHGAQALHDLFLRRCGGQPQVLPQVSREAEVEAAETIQKEAGQQSEKESRETGSQSTQEGAQPEEGLSPQTGPYSG